MSTQSVPPMPPAVPQAAQIAPLSLPNSNSNDRPENDTIRVLSLVGFAVCGGIQVLTVASLSEISLLIGVIFLVWFALQKAVFPLMLFALGNVGIRFYLTAEFDFFRDQSAMSFVFHTIDNLSYLLMVVLGLIYVELAPKRLSRDEKPEETNSTGKSWHVFEPFRGLLISVPLALTLAMIVYGLINQIETPINRYILKPTFARTYLFCCILFVLFIFSKSILDFLRWRSLTNQEAGFYVQSQIGLSIHHDVDQLAKRGWSKEDHASACGFVFFLQCIIASAMAIVLIFLARSNRFGGAEFTWPAIAAVFVVFTSAYNLKGTSKKEVTSEPHIISLVSFLVIVVVGVQSLNFPPWPWGIVFLIWTAFNAVLLVRLSYLWMLDEMFARKNQWERAQPFSIIRTSLILLEALIGLAALIVVSLQLVDYAQKAGL